MWFLLGSDALPGLGSHFVLSSSKWPSLDPALDPTIYSNLINILFLLFRFVSSRLYVVPSTGAALSLLDMSILENHIDQRTHLSSALDLGLTSPHTGTS